MRLLQDKVILEYPEEKASFVEKYLECIKKVALLLKNQKYIDASNAWIEYKEDGELREICVQMTDEQGDTQSVVFEGVELVDFVKKIVSCEESF